MVSKRKIVLVSVAAIILFAISACAKAAPTEDPSLKITEVYNTVQAELTRVFLLTPSATPTPTPTETATPEPATPTIDPLMVTPTKTKTLPVGVTGDNAAYDNDITIPDYSIIKPGTTFDKTWSIRNNGTTTWTKEYQLIYLEGPQPAVLYVKLNKEVAPGELVQVTVRFTAPTTLGTYTGWWRMYSANGLLFGEPLSLIFTVGNETATPTSNVTASTPGTPTVTPTVTATTP